MLLNNSMSINIGENTFYEKINVYKFDYIIKNYGIFKDIIDEQEKDMRRLDKNYNVLAVLMKIKKNIFIPNELRDTEFGYIKITYRKGKNSNGKGRWYADGGIGLQSLCVCIRHTICKNIWEDSDQVNCHPTICKWKMIQHSLKTPLLDKYLEQREIFLQQIMEEEKCTRDTAKTLVIATINGAKYKTKKLKIYLKNLNQI